MIFTFRQLNKCCLIYSDKESWRFVEGITVETSGELQRVFQINTMCVALFLIFLFCSKPVLGLI
jgi:hypothetical protein